MKSSKFIYILVTLIFSACGIIPTPTETPLTSTPVYNSPTPLPQISLGKTYTSPKYGYALDYPDIYSVTTVSDEYVEIGEKIVVTVELPTPSAGGPVLVTESTADLTVSDYSATLLTGHIDSIGGYIPQQFRRIVIKPIGPNIVITVYALGLYTTEGDISQIALLNPEDISLFDKIVTSFKFP
ncbi:MAG: hypothetical protein NTW69_20100 [Chloroflexi bacterium]|nr:hypothetical protein [Chloroflexota bacterium]